MEFRNILQSKWALVLLGLVVVPAASARSSRTDPEPPPQFLAHPLYATRYTCTEHAAGDLGYLGDDLGQDCLVQEFVESDGRAFTRLYRNDGYSNADWYGWNQPVLSPCDCTVRRILLNPVTNEPGIAGKPPASMILLEAADGTQVVLGHIQDPVVREGEAVRAGQQLARVGNNGYSRNPHIHIGAWRDEQPLQIRWDQRRIASP
jgi:Membrane proteins related to metalloendopeptidases